MTQYDTFNLRHLASFCVPVFMDVNWIPVNSLGKTRCTNKQIQLLTHLSREEKQQKISCLYEAIQLLQLGYFLSCDDNIALYDNDILWSIHTDGKTAADVNAGCCASVANWLVYMLHGLYDEVGIISIVSNTGIGHAVNYIRHRDLWYVLDANAFLKDHQNYICSETGFLADFRTSKIVTGAFFQVVSLEAFAYFFSTFIGRVKQRTFVFCRHPEEIRWEGFRKCSTGQTETFWPAKNTSIIGTIPTKMSVLFSHIPPFPLNINTKRSLT